MLTFKLPLRTRNNKQSRDHFICLHPSYPTPLILCRITPQLPKLSSSHGINMAMCFASIPQICSFQKMKIRTPRGKTRKHLFTFYLPRQNTPTRRRDSALSSSFSYCLSSSSPNVPLPPSKGADLQM